MSQTRPYLSVVVTTRNDNHGGNPLGRFQAFVNCLTSQCRRVNLPAELIVVEWNPPDDRPPLRAALRWPLDSPCEIRIVQVPPHLHRALEHAEALPLFQMIAKNVGIRRARGEFVLSTNIDILLPNELVDAIVARSLQPGVMYRADRHDVDADVPVDASLDAQMEFCRSHQIRKNTRTGSFPLHRAGASALWHDDIVAAANGIQFGDGWHMREGFAGEPYRWVADSADLIVEPSSAPRLLNIEIEPNPFVERSRVDFSVTDAASGESLSSTSVANVFHSHTITQVPIPPGSESRRLTLRGANPLVTRDDLPVFENREQLIYRVHRIWWEPARARSPYAIGGWRASPDGHARVDAVPNGVAVVTAPTNLLYAVEYMRMVAPAAGPCQFWITLSISEGSMAIQVLNHDRSGFLPVKTRFFNRGSDTFECEIVVDLDAGQPFWFVISNAREDGNRPSRFTILSMHGTYPPEQIMNMTDLTGTRWTRVKSTVREWLGAGAKSGYEPPLEDAHAANASRGGAAENTGSGDRETAAGTKAALEAFRAFLVAFRPDGLHLNACGDFQLMAREDWHRLRGFAEFEMYSMNIDGLFGHMAHYGGVREEVLPWPVYHIEHETGSGWTPEGESKLRKRIQERGIGWLDSTTVTILASFMKSVRRPMIFNGADWGFAQHELPETVLTNDTVTRTTR